MARVLTFIFSFDLSLTRSSESLVSPDFGFLASTPHAQVAAHPVLLAGADKNDG